MSDWAARQRAAGLSTRIPALLWIKISSFSTQCHATLCEPRPSLTTQRGRHCGFCAHHHCSEAPWWPPCLLAGCPNAALCSPAPRDQGMSWWVLPGCPGLLWRVSPKLCDWGQEGNMLLEGEVVQVAVAMVKHALLILFFLIYIFIYFCLWTEKVMFGIHQHHI